MDKLIVNNLYKKMQLALAVTLCASSFSAMAAIQGTVGPTSEGSFNVTYNKGAEVRIWGLQDVSLNGDDNDVTAGPLSSQYTFCTYSNNTDELLFKVGSSNNDFTLQNTGGSGDDIPYTVALSDKGGAPKDVWGAGSLASGVQGYDRYITQGDNKGTPGSNVCGPSEQTTVVKVNVPQLSTAPADGAYTDTVTLTISPI